MAKSPNDPAIEVRKSFSASLHVAAKEFGVDPRSMAEAGIYDFVNIDAIKFGADAHKLALAALQDLPIDTNGDWEGCWIPIVQGIMVFMIEQGFEKPSKECKAEIQAMKAKRPNSNDLKAWFEKHFPAPDTRT